jgi:hypothetical protein
MASISTRLGNGPQVKKPDLRVLLDDARLDLAALRAAIVAITAKLDADGGVTDTNYAATTNPAALRTVA